MKKYDEYKPSGVDWIGEVPNGWNVMKLLYCLRQAICDGPHETPKQVEDGIPFISIDSLNDTKDIDFSVVSKFISEEDYQNYMKKAKLEKGDILFSKAATIGKTAIVGDEKFMVWSPLAILKNNPQKLNNNFLYHLVNCQRLITSIALSGSYNTQINVGMREMEKASIPVSSLTEQTAIANYLDTKCAKIDNVVAIQQKRIELLKELKQSIITKAVTKGLDKNAKMKDSGVEWIGEVPEGWEVCRIKNVLELLTDYDANGSFADIAKNCNINNGNPYAWMVRATDLANNRYGIVDGNNYCDYSTYKYLRKSSLVSNDVLIAKRGEIGKVYIVPECSVPMTLAPNTYLLKVKLSKIEKKFLYYLLSSDYGKISLMLNNKSTTLGALYKDDVKDIQISVPPIDEQKRIITFIEKKSDSIDRQIAKIDKQIELLKEYKQSVITECVTGKRKVC